MDSAHATASQAERATGVLDRLLTPEELAETLRVKKSWIYGKVHNDTLPFPHLKVRAYLRFRARDVAAYIE